MKSILRFSAVVILLGCASSLETPAHTLVPCSSDGANPFAVTHQRMTAPTPKDDIVPPPPPRSAYGKFATVFAVIDSTGKANPDSVSVCGVTNAAFARELAAAVAKVEFNPAMSEGRPTRSVFTAHLSFGRALPVPRD